jgi:thiamine biosynthesis protein ThiI
VKFELIIVRYGEIALKAKQTRKRFESVLVNNIKDALESKNLQNKLRKEWGRIYIYSDQIEKCVSVLKKIFGISSISPAIQTDSKIKEISKISKSISKPKLDNKKSFAIRVTRTGDHDFTSQDIAVHVGSEIVKVTKANVDLTKPDFELFIEVRYDNAFLFFEKIKGYGGMPIGTQGNILAIINNQNALLASWYLIHRGCRPIFLSTDEIDKEVFDKFLNNWFIKSKRLVISKSDNLYEQINKKATENNCDAIVTGLTLSENSKNEIKNIKQSKKQINLPILHPLIAMDKEEIKRKIKEIGLAK